MADQLVRVHLKEPDLLVVALLCTDTSRFAASNHACLPTSAAAFAQGIAAGVGIAAVLGGNARINLQLACDGPLKGMFVDADSAGQVRGYPKNAAVNFLPPPDGRFLAGAALGTSGMLSVTRELKGGEFYRGSVSMEHAELAADLERYYAESEQIDTLVQLEVLTSADEPIVRAGGLFVQAMPDAEAKLIAALRPKLEGALLRALTGARDKAMDLVAELRALYPDSELDVMAECPVGYFCSCSYDRVLRAVVAVGRAEIEDLLATEGKAVATCAFCNSVYEVSGETLKEILTGLPASGGPPN